MLLSETPSPDPVHCLIDIDEEVMFTTLFSHTQVYQLPHEMKMEEAGDFDNTPAPSSRPSLVTLRINEENKESGPNA